MQHEFLAHQLTLALEEASHANRLLYLGIHPDLVRWQPVIGIAGGIVDKPQRWIDLNVGICGSVQTISTSCMRCHVFLAGNQTASVNEHLDALSDYEKRAF